MEIMGVERKLEEEKRAERRFDWSACAAQIRREKYGLIGPAGQPADLSLSLGSHVPPSPSPCTAAKHHN